MLSRFGHVHSPQGSSVHGILKAQSILKTIKIYELDISQIELSFYVMDVVHLFCTRNVVVHLHLGV